MLFSSGRTAHLTFDMRLPALLLLTCQAAATLAAADLDSSNTLLTVRHTNMTPLVEGPNDPAIVKFVAGILQRQHYLRTPINDEVSSKFLDRYLDSMDNLHLYFLQSDLDEFEK